MAGIIVEEATLCYRDGAERDAALRAVSRTYNIRAAHVAPAASMWATLKLHGNDMGYLHYLHVTRDVFGELVAAVPPAIGAWLDGWTDATRTARRPGPPSQLDVGDHIAMALAWSASQLNQKWLGAVFGTLDAVTSTALLRGVIMLNEGLKIIPDAAITWPTFEEQRSYADLVRMWASETFGPAPLPCNIMQFIDGFFIYSDAPNDVWTQEVFYSRYDAGCGMRTVVSYGPRGRIAWAALCNVGDLAHEFNASRPLQERLADPTWTLPGFSAAGDWAYASASTRYTMATPAYLSGAFPISPERRERWIRWHKAVRSVAEFGMRHMRGMWPRMNSRMPTRLANARLLMSVWMRLQNLLVSRVDGHSQLKTMFEVAAAEFEADIARMDAAGL